MTNATVKFYRGQAQKRLMEKEKNRQKINARMDFLSLNSTISILTDEGYTCLSELNNKSIIGNVSYNVIRDNFTASISYSNNITNIVQASTRIFPSLTDAVEWTQLVCYCSIR